MCVSRVMEPSRYLYHERIHLTAQLHAGHINTPHSSSVVRRFKEEFLSFLEFVFVPFNCFEQRQSEQVRESCIKWAHLNSFDHKLSPFVLGLLFSGELGPHSSWKSSF